MYTWDTVGSGSGAIASVCFSLDQELGIQKDIQKSHLICTAPFRDKTINTYVVIKNLAVKVWLPGNSGNLIQCILGVCGLLDTFWSKQWSLGCLHRT